MLCACEGHEGMGCQPVGHSPLPAGLKGKVGADRMGAIANEHTHLVGAVALSSLCHDGGFCPQPLPARPLLVNFQAR